MRFLIVYGTTDGQTAEIAERIAGVIRSAGHSVVCSEAKTLDAKVDLRRFDAVLVGASVHIIKYQRRITRFIRRHLQALHERPTAFFSVCLAIAHNSEADRKEALELPRRYVEKLGWKPETIEVIAGALRFSRYGFLRRPSMKKIALEKLGPLDTTRDYVFTDWNQVDQFARGFAAYVERVAGPERAGAEAPTAPGAGA